ncbi:MAG: ankyrin repeat domain-containing protein, partial [Gemmatimonadetes bacterium]|nr:ankyrin repeat domain-containing protein [Gemmatimonadota bacterium]
MPSPLGNVGVAYDGPPATPKRARDRFPVESGRNPSPRRLKMTTQRTGKGPADRFRHESVTESVGRGLKRPWTARLSALVLAFAVLGASGPADSPVADAAERGDLEAVRALLRNGADVNTAQSDGMTALHWAASRNDAEIARALLYAGATVRATTRLGGYTPLHLASRAGSPEVAKQILEAGADPNVYTSTGVSAMHFAADADAPEVVALLAAHGAEVDARDTFSERTPLMFASVRGADAALAALLAAGADPALTTALKDYPAISTAWRAEQQQRRRVRAAAEEPEEEEEEEEPRAQAQQAQTPPAQPRTPARPA